MLWRQGTHPAAAAASGAPACAAAASPGAQPRQRQHRPHLAPPLVPRHPPRRDVVPQVAAVAVLRDLHQLNRLMSGPWGERGTLSGRRALARTRRQAGGPLRAASLQGPRRRPLPTPHAGARCTGRARLTSIVESGPRLAPCGGWEQAGRPNGSLGGRPGQAPPRCRREHACSAPRLQPHHKTPRR